VRGRLDVIGATDLAAIALASRVDASSRSQASPRTKSCRTWTS